MKNQWKTKRIPSYGRKKVNRRGASVGRNNQSSSAKGSWYTIASWILTAVIFVSVLYVVFRVIPRLTITIIPETRDVVVEDTLVLSTTEPDGDGDNYLMVKRVSVNSEIQEEFLATGEIDVGDKASGSVVFYNGTGLTYELFTEDVLETIDSIKFSVTRDVAIPPAYVSADGEIVPGSIESEITAIEPGEDSNIDPQRIFIRKVSPDKQNMIYAENKNKLTGGNSKKVVVISQDDISTARERLRKSISNSVIQDIKDGLNYGQIVLEETLSLSDEVFKSDTNIGDETSSFTYSMSATADVLVIDEQVLNEVLLGLAYKKIGPNEQFIFTDPDEREFKDVRVDIAGNTLIDVYATWKVSKPVDFDSLKSEILGLREADARRILFKNPAITDVRFDWNFAILRRIPSISSRVTMELGASE